MTDKEICYEIINNSDDLVYVTDIKTNKVIFANKRLLQVIGKSESEVFGKLCYQALQGKESPCEFCTNAVLSAENFMNGNFSGKICSSILFYMIKKS
ncbi:MAG: PAS domain-containing protein [Acidaminococcaceae bacterium]|nr:PAS domain-containing protein [Acidaminococcaceae bacterium]